KNLQRYSSSKMVKCDICLVYSPNSECLGENCLFVNYGIALKVKNDAVFRAKFEKLNDILSIQSIELLMEIMYADSCSGYCFRRRCFWLEFGFEGQHCLWFEAQQFDWSQKGVEKHQKNFQKKERLA
ncbi:hypothetical protein AABB24_020104, partial [Solanum stoloniferum]